MASALPQDRLDQRALPLDGTYRTGATAEPWPGATAAAADPDSSPAVNIYILDSGIRATHAEFSVAAGASTEQAGAVRSVAVGARRSRVFPG